MKGFVSTFHIFLFRTFKSVQTFLELYENVHVVVSFSTDLGTSHLLWGGGGDGGGWVHFNLRQQNFYDPPIAPAICPPPPHSPSRPR